MFHRRRRSLLYIWTVRYFLILFLSMATIGASTLYFVHRNVDSSQIRGMLSVAGDIAEMAAGHGGRLPGEPELSGFLDDRIREYGLNARPILFILDRDGATIQQFPSHSTQETEQLAERMNEIMTTRPGLLELKPLADQTPLRVAVHPILESGVVVGYALYAAPKIRVFQGFLGFVLPRMIIILTMCLCGWLIVYMMTRRLAKPVQEAAEAANQIVSGHYQVELDKDYKEKEIHELMVSFKEMAGRLERLESLRTQLLASVTHELKTPVASISGLLQAVREEVVTGEEAALFLEEAMKESNRMQRMVEDLLDLNRFAAQSVEVVPGLVDIREAVTEAVARWRLSLREPEMRIAVEAPDESRDWRVWTDGARLEQILINLLNNGKEAIRPPGQICVRLIQDASVIHIQVQDTGDGIPAEEQEEIFEAFYRGKHKRNKVRGLGIGLPFSRMIARSLGGDLVLEESGPGGSTFTILVPRNVREVQID